VRSLCDKGRQRHLATIKAAVEGWREDGEDP
jgi:hypothetical protein